MLKLRKAAWTKSPNLIKTESRSSTSRIATRHHHSRLRNSHSDIEAHNEDDSLLSSSSYSTLPRSFSKGSNSRLSTKKNFLEGFRHTLRPKGIKPELIRTNSDTVTSNNRSSLTTDSTMILVSGSRVRAAIDHCARHPQELNVRRGDFLRIVDFEANKGYFVETSENCRGYVPLHVINSIASTALKKPSWSLLPKERRSKSLIEVFATMGQQKVQLKCPRISEESTSCVWTLPDDRVLVKSSTKFIVSSNRDAHLLEIVGEVGERHQGAYVAQERNGDKDLSSTLIHLRLLKPLTIPPEVIQDDQGLILRWTNSDSIRGTFNVEFCSLPSSTWQLLVTGIQTCSCSLSSLSPLESSSTLLFRVMRIEDGQYSPSSSPFNMTAKSSENGLKNGKNVDNSSNFESLWQRDFERTFIELEELGRGRFSVVRRCQHIISGEEKAVKFVNRQRQSREFTQKEFHIMLKLGEHPSLIKAEALFITATSDAIVMQLISGAPLLEHICEEPMYSEELVRNLLLQLTHALSHLHKHNVAHLDLKPENVIVDYHNQIRLIDFGLSRDLAPKGNNDKNEENKNHAERIMKEVENNCNSSDLEFLAPEIVTHTNAEVMADLWSLGVIVYVALSGVSPFLDDSVDETRHNLLTCDFSFPSEYFSKISREAQLLISRLLRPDPKTRLSAENCLSDTWFLNEAETRPLISSLTLATLSRRRAKKLNSLVPILDKVRSRPESYYYQTK